MRDNRQHFICPECGNTEPGEETMVSPEFDINDPRTEVMQWLRCNQCGVNIPAHIAERWDNLTEEEARQAWHDKYRNLPEME